MWVFSLLGEHATYDPLFYHPCSVGSAARERREVRGHEGVALHLDCLQGRKGVHPHRFQYLVQV